MPAINDGARRRTDHLECDGGRDRQRGCVRQRPRLRGLAWPGAEANLDGRSHDPRQDIKAWQSLSARPVRSGGLGGAGQDRAKALVALWARDLDRGGQQAPASQVLAIALANKLARIAWAVLYKGRAFECVKTDAMASRPA